MNELTCHAFAYRLQGLSDRVILRRLMSEGQNATEAQAQTALREIQGINQNALPVPQVTCHHEKLPDGKIKWWQNNWFSDQWDEIEEAEFEIRRRTAIMLYHKVVKGLPEE